MDSILAARRIAPGGTVIGVDMTEEMLAKARRNTEALWLCHLDYQLGQADALPVPTATVDVIITNRVFKVAPH